MTTGKVIAVRGFQFKDGKLQRDPKRLDVSARIRMKNSKKVRVARKTTR